jgi:NAD(P)-dependent dehydrogenase (short-subunit alcohol dehydrogenase family)
MSDNSDLSVIITGGASGIGAATARRILADGGTVGLIDIDQNRGEALAKELGDKACFALADALSESEMAAAHDALAAQMPPVNGLLAAAGAPQVPKRIEDHDLKAYKEILDSHSDTTFIANKIVGGAIAARGPGTVVNISSIIAFNPGPILAYGAGKAVIANMTKILAVQWAKAGVRVNAVAPGFTETPFLFKGERQGARDFSPMISSMPVDRILQPEEIAEVIFFLLSPASSAVTGQVLSCDGGTLAGAGWWGFNGFENAYGS